MSLSNWDTLIVDHQGKNLVDGMEFSNGVEIRLLKNWLSIGDPDAWREGSGLIHPYVMRVWAGDITYQGISIMARRGPDDGVYFAAWTAKTGILGIGIGIYGYEGDAYLGILRSHVDFLRGCIFQGWSGERELPSWMQECDLSQAARYNQGDAYFAEHLGIPVPGTVTGDEVTLSDEEPDGQTDPL